MLKNSFFFYLLITCSLALIDPPIEEIKNHNIAIAPLEKVGNVFSMPEKNPTLEDPTFFFYVKILTLNPAINKTINSDNHPSIIWLVAEDHIDSITSVNGETNFETQSKILQYTGSDFFWNNDSASNQSILVVSTPTDNGVNLNYFFNPLYPSPNISFFGTDPIVLDPDTDPPKEPSGCSKTIITRAYKDLEIVNVSANYKLTGILNKEGENFSIKTVEKEQTLATDFPISPVEIPFKSSWCSFLESISKLIFGNYFNYKCYEESLSHASPYSTGVYNLTVRNLTVVNPNLSVILDAKFIIPYDEEKEICRETDEGCECEIINSVGDIELVDYDNDSYEVANSYLSIVPYSPSFMELNVNTSEDVIYYFTLLSTLPIYKYYSWMDGNLSAAYYIHNFSVSQDAFGTKFINAHIANLTGLIPEDPLVKNQYLGPHKILLKDQSENLKNPLEIVNKTYNYSKLYSLEEIFFNLSSGHHNAKLDFYSWWGRFPITSDIYARQTTFLKMHTTMNGSNALISCNLSMRNHTPVSNVKILLEFSGSNISTITDENGICFSQFQTNSSFGIVRGMFEGNEIYLPSYANAPISRSFFDFGSGVIIDNFILLSFVSLVALYSFLRIDSSASILSGAVASTFSKTNFIGKAPLINTHRFKKGKELQLAIAAALTGGAGAAVASNAAKSAAGSAAGKGAASLSKSSSKIIANSKNLNSVTKKTSDSLLKNLDKKKKAMIEIKSNVEKKSPLLLLATGGRDDDDENGKKKVFDKFLADKTSKKQLEKKDLLTDYVEKGKITQWESDRLVCSRASASNIKDWINTGSPQKKLLLQNYLQGEIGEANCAGFLNSLGFNVETEVYTSSISKHRIDIMGKSTTKATLNFRSVDLEGQIVTKEASVNAKEIVGIESKSYSLGSYNKDNCQHLYLQIATSASNENIQHTYAYLSSDIEQMSVEKRANIAKEIAISGGEVIISSNSSLNNKFIAENILDKLRD